MTVSHAAPPPSVTEITLLPPVTRVRRVLRHPRLMHHNRLAVSVLVVNLAVLVLAVHEGWWSGHGVALSAISDVVLGNFALAILIRQQYVINMLFRLATSAPTSWPLKVRWLLAKVYHFGGLHVGGAVSGTLWLLAFEVSMGWAALSGTNRVATAPLVICGLLTVLSMVIVATAWPSVRARLHDRFERVHRFGGWLALVLFWTQTLLFVAGGRGGSALPAALLASPSVWVLCLVTISVALPWLRLRRVAVTVRRPSSHVAVVHFDHGVTPFAGSSTSVSRSPLREWHSFANVPTPGRSGFRLTISRAGDWTGSFIDDAPSHVWVKGITTAGVANVEKLFTKVVYVATGSGIGPVLPHLLAAEVPARLVWATRDPRGTYGDELVDEILSAQPDAMIWNTSLHGKPDMLELAYRAYATFGAEAVICISNKKLTWQVVHGLESRGVPAYGAIWDS
jgi:hypothetical protein